jgi:prepilin-type processing-associated H-X9-DG protein
LLNGYLVLERRQKMFCPKCGKENPDTAQLCISCNSLLPNLSAQPASPAQTSRLAITSLVLGIMAPFTCMLTLIPAVICGIIALVKINRSHGQLKGSGLAIAGIVVPVALLPIMAIMTAIMIPALSKAREQARVLICQANLKQLNSSVKMYAYDHHNAFPTPEKWCDQIKPYIDNDTKRKNIFRCPASKNGTCATGNANCTYAINKYIRRPDHIKSPETTVLIFESKPGWNQNGGPELLSTENHGGKGANILFCDGHVSFVIAEDIHNLKWDPNQ